jgi:AraC-like DNA-binding protein
MANVLELNAEQINLNDPTLRSAISDKGETNLYDFQRQLRKDSRWQYTQNARQEVSDITLNVLRDFGFQG